MNKRLYRRLLLILVIFLVFVTSGALAGAESLPSPIDGIADNSFLVEEAYNQEAGVVQHIFTGSYGTDLNSRPHPHGWAFSFTQEWPVFSQSHQFSYTIPFSFIREGKTHQDGIGDVLLNYRLQALEEHNGFPAFAPRFSLVLPTGDRNDGTGNGVVGYQWNLPISKKIGPRLATHVNFGLTFLPDVRVPLEADEKGSLIKRQLSHSKSLVSYNLGASVIFAYSSRVHLMLEWLGNADTTLNEQGKKEHDFSAVISPGIRAAVINTDQLQVVFGAAVPFGLTTPADDYGAFLYLSIEHNFL